MGSNPVCSRPTVRMANPRAMRRAKVPPHVADIAAKPITSIHRTNNKHASWPHCPGLGVRSARRIAPAADAIIQRLVHVPELGGCLHELNSAGNALDHICQPSRVDSVVVGSQTTSHASRYLGSGHTDGNTTRPPLLSTISGGPWC